MVNITTIDTYLLKHLIPDILKLLEINKRKLARALNKY